MCVDGNAPTATILHVLKTCSESGIPGELTKLHFLNKITVCVLFLLVYLLVSRHPFP